MTFLFWYHFLWYKHTNTIFITLLAHGLLVILSVLYAIDMVQVFLIQASKQNFRLLTNLITRIVQGTILYTCNVYLMNLIIFYCSFFIMWVMPVIRHVEKMILIIVLSPVEFIVCWQKAIKIRKLNIFAFKLDARLDAI